MAAGAMDAGGRLAVGGGRWAVGGCRSVGDGCRVRAWWWAPYNVVLSRRHEPVEHNRTCARSLGRKSQDFGCGRSRSRSRSEECGVVVREILWSGRGVTNTRGPLRSGCRSAVGSANGVKGASERKEPGEQTRAARQAGGVWRATGNGQQANTGIRRRGRGKAEAETQPGGCGWVRVWVVLLGGRARAAGEELSRRRGPEE